MNSFKEDGDDSADRGSYEGKHKQGSCDFKEAHLRNAVYEENHKKNSGSSESGEKEVKDREKDLSAECFVLKLENMYEKSYCRDDTAENQGHKISPVYFCTNTSN